MSKRKTYIFSTFSRSTPSKGDNNIIKKIDFSYHKRLWKWCWYFHIFFSLTRPPPPPPEKWINSAIKKNTLVSYTVFLRCIYRRAKKNASDRKWFAWKTDRWTHEWNNKITWTWPKVDLSHHSYVNVCTHFKQTNPCKWHILHFAMASMGHIKKYNGHYVMDNMISNKIPFFV